MNSRLEFGQHLTDRGLVGEGVEVGTLFGDYAECLLATWPGKLHCVDPWIQQSAKVYRDGSNAVDFDEAFGRTQKRLAQYGDRAVLHRHYSAHAARSFFTEELSFVYLDANHSYKSVCEDIAAWLPKIKHGGILGGHDYYERHDDYQDCGVKNAVDELVKESGLQLTLTPACTSWWIDKP